MSSLRSNTPDPDDSSDSILGIAVDIQDSPWGGSLFLVLDLVSYVDLRSKIL